MGTRLLAFMTSPSNLITAIPLTQVKIPTRPSSFSVCKTCLGLQLSRNKVTRVVIQAVISYRCTRSLAWNILRMNSDLCSQSSHGEISASSKSVWLKFMFYLTNKPIWFCGFFPPDLWSSGELSWEMFNQQPMLSSFILCPVQLFT